MPARRVSVPGADDLFRPTAVPAVAEPTPIHVVPEAGEKLASGRIKHDEKMTVYLSNDELLEIEQARLTLRRSLGSAVDRGRIVRAAVALALEELESKGEKSALARRLRQS